MKSSRSILTFRQRARIKTSSSRSAQPIAKSPRTGGFRGPERLLPSTLVCALYAAALFAIAAIAAAAQKLPAARAHPVDFNRQVLPILSENCFLCHGTDTSKRFGGLRLDNSGGATKLLASGKAAIVPGSLEKSELVARITAHDGSQMPPSYAPHKLSPAQIATLKQWVAEGAKYAPHWSYVVPARPIVPSAGKSTWPSGAIDRFLLARMQQAGLSPSPAANRRTLVRRLSLDLTGLPPSPEEAARFLNDSRPGATERLVDRLLASPHYGERMAVWWLDLVRYADTVGYHGDQDVSVWPYRDYVINAFNSNMRFDQFTREQLAGDLLPHPTPEQRTASCYNRLGMMSTEGGIQDKEYLAKYASDRIHNASNTWLAATMQCCECHDHKYDLFTQKDFYSFGAFFADIQEHGFYPDGYSRGDWGPSIHLPNTQQSAQLAAYESQIGSVKARLAAVSDTSLAAGRAAWEAGVRERAAAHSPAWATAVPLSARSSGGSTMTIGKDGVVSVSGKLPDFDVYTVTVPANLPEITAVRLEALDDDSLAGNGISRAGWYFILSDFDVSVQRGSGAAVSVPLATVDVSGDDEGYPGMAAIDGKPDTGWAIVWAHTGDHNAVFRFDKPIQGGADVRLVIRLHHETKPRLEIGKFRLSLSGLAHPTLDANGMPDEAYAALQKPTGSRTTAETAAVAAAYRQVAPELEADRRKLAWLEADRSILLGRIPDTLVTAATTPRIMRVLPRGNWMDDSGTVVQPAVPHFLRQIHAAGRASRLDLANWLVAPDNPLTARVVVNRLWKMYFGVGLSKTLDDFGVQGEPPVAPKLLDWLASEFVASGWNVKHIVRLIVTSSAYSQSSIPTAAGEEKDPDNRYCARQMPIRLEAEFIRDTALEISGLLSSQVGGPSAHPYEPKGYLAALNFPRREYAPDAGSDLYRRGLYTQWQRSFLHPALLAFDAPTREEGVCTRAISNTPVQALVLLNDPSFVEAARVFAARIIRDGGRSFDSRLRYAYLVALTRDPEPAEARLLHTLYAQQRSHFANDRAAASELLHTGEAPQSATIEPVEQAAWTSVARALLNLHETITRS